MSARRQKEGKGGLALRVAANSVSLLGGMAAIIAGDGHHSTQDTDVPSRVRAFINDVSTQWANKGFA